MKRRLSLCVAAGSIALTGAAAASEPLSKTALLEMVEEGAATQLMIERVEEACVDFEVSAATVAELAGRVPRQVLMAAIDCAEEPPESRECRFYRALAREPRLADFPIVLLWVEGADLGLLEIATGVWLEEQGMTGGLRKRFKALSEHSDRHRAAVDVLEQLPGVKSYTFDSDSNLSSSELAAEQRIAILDACSQRARVLITSEPTGATVRLDGREVSSTPVVTDLLADEYFLEISAPGHEPDSGDFRLEDGERREVHVVLEEKPTIEVVSEPSAAIVLLDGTFAGHTPAKLSVDAGRHRMHLVARGRPVHREDLFAERGELITLDIDLEAPVDPNPCFEAPVSGPVSRSWRELGAALQGIELEMLVPLYEVVSSTIEREIPSTHVLDGTRVLFKPGTSKSFFERPLDLIGLELGGEAFGETAVEVLESAPGPVTVTGLQRKKSTLRLDLVHHSGDENALFLDFSRDLDLVEAGDVLAALCSVATR